MKGASVLVCRTLLKIVARTWCRAIQQVVHESTTSYVAVLVYAGSRIKPQKVATPTKVRACIAGANGCGPYPDALSFLVAKIDGSLLADDPCGGPMPMGLPFGVSTVSAQDITAIQTWIDAGAPENCTAIPTAGTWGLICCSIIFLIVGYLEVNPSWSSCERSADLSLRDKASL